MLSIGVNLWRYLPKKKKHEASWACLEMKISIVFLQRKLSQFLLKMNYLNLFRSEIPIGKDQFKNGGTTGFGDPWNHRKPCDLVNPTKPRPSQRENWATTPKLHIYLRSVGPCQLQMQLWGPRLRRNHEKTSICLVWKCFVRVKMCQKIFPQSYCPYAPCMV